MAPSIDMDQARDFHQQLSQAMIDANVEEMETLLDDAATLTHMSGYVQSKAEWLDEVASGSMAYHSLKTVSEKIEDGLYVVTTICDATIWGSRNDWHLGLRYQLDSSGTKALKITAFSW